jgi:hypothetical protein
MREADRVGRAFLPITFAFAFPSSTKGTKKPRMGMELKSTDLISISSLVEHVCLPVVLGNVQNDALKGFNQGRRTGSEEERNRTRHFFHDVLSTKLLVASFLAHEIHQKLAASGAAEAEDMARLSKLLQQAIEAIVRGAEEY